MRDATDVKGVEAAEDRIRADGNNVLTGIAIGSKNGAPKENSMFCGPHDCGPRALSRVVPELRREQIQSAFVLCSEKWPHGGVSNKEFEMTMKYLQIRHRYSGEQETLQDLLDRNPHRCVALLWGHFVAIRDGKIVGRERLCRPPSEINVVCSWSFH